ncbi:uncharacterized protein LOC134737792 isoform X2 [Pongo pygmaeus]|uniref:uncharacterized protein LOC134737792 isoform X2 n=1 Tax=Pongo pygmaeus TaxID=9600 RepID=UPI00300D1EB3
MGAAIAPGSPGAAPSGPAILEGLFCPFLPLRKCSSRRWLTSCDFCPFPFLLGLSQIRKGPVRNVLHNLSGKAANVALLRLPCSLPVGRPPCFLNTKWRHVRKTLKDEVLNSRSQNVGDGPPDFLTGTYPVLHEGNEIKRLQPSSQLLSEVVARKTSSGLPLIVHYGETWSCNTVVKNVTLEPAC